MKSIRRVVTTYPRLARKRAPGHLMPDYDAARRGFELRVPELYNWTKAVLDRLASDRKRQAMLWVGHEGTEQTLTYADFADASRRFANVLGGLGVKRGERDRKSTRLNSSHGMSSRMPSSA